MMNIDSLAKLSMDGKVAVVTGSTQGLGETIAHLFAERGAAGMVITGRNARNGARVAADLEKKASRDLRRIDLAKMDDAEVIAACDKQFGRIDALVNSAASPTAARSGTRP
jgi:short-subunit dehydrogenase